MKQTNFRDYFQILGIDSNVNETDIKKAFRKLARKYHPDLHQGEKNYESNFR